MSEAVLFDRRGRPALDFAQATAELSRMDPQLGALIGRVGPFTLRPRPLRDVFEALGEAILRQQVSGAAADAIQRKLNAHFGARAFPPAARLAESSPEDLRHAGVSGAKARALIELAGHQIAGRVPTAAALHRMDNAGVVDALIGFRGIGRWTAEMLLMFRMARADVFPDGDYGIRKGFQRTFRKRALPPSRQMLPRAARWRPYRTVASWYLWRSLEL